MGQFAFFKEAQKHRFNSGGGLRKKRAGRKSRRLSTKHPLHLIFKINKSAIPRGLRHPKTRAIINEVVLQYSHRFFVRVEQISIQRDHIHALVRAARRAQFQHFFRVVAGQIAQRVTGTLHETYEGERVWKERPFTRIVLGERAIRIVRNYIQLNEKEARGEIPYRKQRLRGLTKAELAKLWD